MKKMVCIFITIYPVYKNMSSGLKKHFRTNLIEKNCAFYILGELWECRFQWKNTMRFGVMIYFFSIEYPMQRQKYSMIWNFFGPTTIRCREWSKSQIIMSVIFLESSIRMVSIKEHQVFLELYRESYVFLAQPI